MQPRAQTRPSRPPNQRLVSFDDYRRRTCDLARLTRMASNYTLPQTALDALKTIPASVGLRALTPMRFRSRRHVTPYTVCLRRPSLVLILCECPAVRVVWKRDTK